MRLPRTASASGTLRRRSADNRSLGQPSGSDKLERCLEQCQVFFVIRDVSAIDLDPFTGARNPTRLKRHDVISGELQFGRRGHRQTQADAIATDAREHLVAYEVGIEAVYFP